MKSHLRFGILWIALFVICGVVGNASAANPFLHQLFTNNMVLQRDVNAPVWGWTTSGKTVTVKIFNETSALLQTRTTVAGPDGRWQVAVGPFGLVTNNAAYRMEVSAPGVTTNTRSNILIGDVWLCTGQSNMAYSMQTIGVYNYANEIADSANYPNIRHFFVPQVSSNTTLETLGGASWNIAGASTTASFSAAGYFLAREIYKQQGVPIGILTSAWAGSQIKLWMDPEFVSSFADFSQPLFDQRGAGTINSFSGGYNGMIAPLAPLAIKAAIWYQGEGNATQPEQYGRLLPAMISKWRSLFSQPNLPFLIVQVTNTDSYAGLRDTQLNVVKNDPNTRLITTIDIGENQLHPKNKQDVGLRASWAAANLVYGQNVVNQGPLFTGATVSGNTIRCAFSNVGAGLMVGLKTINTTGPQTPTQQVVGGTLSGFTIAGANQTYFAATATIDPTTNTVLVSSPSVSAPVYVRYAWANTNPAANLYNKITDSNGMVVDGLPASPFRSPPVYLININQGTGSGYYALNATVPVSASALVGQTFLNWSGDTSLLSATNTETASATLAQSYVSLAANYQVTGAPTVSAIVANTGQVSLSWTSFTAVHYNVKRSTNLAGPFTTIASNLSGTTRFIDQSVIAGTTYYYTVSALNQTGEGPDSSPVTVSTPALPMNSVQVGLSWSAPGGSVNYYNVKRSTVPGGSYTIISTGSSDLSIIDTNVLSGNTYYYVVSAVNGSGETAIIPELSITPNFLPSPLQDVDIGKVGLNGGAFVSAPGAYSVIGSGAGLDTEFDACNFAYLGAPVTGNFTISARVATLGTSGSYPEAGLMVRSSFSESSPYARIYCNSATTGYEWRNPTNLSIGEKLGSNMNRWIRIVRTNDVCAGWVSPDGVTWAQQGGTVTISGPMYVGLMVTANSNTVRNTAVFDNVIQSPDWNLQIPTSPSGVIASAPTSTSVALNWRASSGATAYNIKRATVSGGPYTTMAGPTNVLSYTNTGLTAGTPYYYTVSATNHIGESLNSTEVTTNQIPKPANLAATPLSETQIRLDWTNNAPSATACEVQRSPANANLWTTLSSSLPGASISYTDASLSPSTSYDFRVRCSAPGLVSEYTLVAAITPAGIGDGIPGWWRFLYFGNGLSITAASALLADPEGDGQRNQAEYLAGTNPVDPGSVFRITAIRKADNEVTLSFNTVAGKTYIVERCNDLSNPWSALQSDIAGTGGVISITFPETMGQLSVFYRARVK